METKSHAINRALELAGSQTALARMAGVSQPAVWHWIHSGWKPSLRAALNIEHATGGAVSHRELLADTCHGD